MHNDQEAGGRVPRVDRLLAILFALLLTAGLSGCTDAGDDPEDGDAMEDGVGDGGDEGDGDAAPVEPAKESATVTFSGIYGAPGATYTESITATQGAELTVTFVNDDNNALTSHDWYLEELDVGTEAIGGGESVDVTFIVDLEPGDYVYYCTIPGHRDGGMEGTLTVTAA